MNCFSSQKIIMEIYRTCIVISSHIKVVLRTKFARECPSNQLPQLVQRCSFTWSYSSLNLNKLMHILFGNRRLGYRIAAWNCRKGLFLQDKSPSEKLSDIKYLLQRHDLHLLGVLESDLHGVSSRLKRARPISTKDILEKLHIDGYAIKLPSSW